MNKELDKSENYYNKILQEFEEYNNTTTSIYDLDSFNVLIILCDGTNVTNYDEVDNKEEIIFISENLYNQKNLVRKYNYPNLKAVITSNFNSMINDISYMFSSCYNLSTVVGLENWDVSNVTDMHGLFKNCNLLNNIDSLSKWNVRSVTNMESMFHDCSMLTNLDALSNWDVSNVVNMDYMFENCNHLQSLEALKNWDVSSLSNLEATFRDCSSLTNLEGLNSWNTIKVEDMTRLFENCYNLATFDAILNWNISNLYSLKKIFNECPKIKFNHEKYNLNDENFRKFGDLVFEEDFEEYAVNEIKQDNVYQTTVLTDTNNGFFDFYNSNELREIFKTLDEMIEK